MNKYILLFLIALSTAQSQTDFSQDSTLAVLKTLAVDIGPRPMGSPAEQQALRFAVGKFKSSGCDTAYIMSMPRSTRVNTTSGIAVGVKRGVTKRIIVIGGHIDSAGPEIPGADDDGSGSAVVIELARVFGRRPTQSTLVFTCFGGEEQGLEGSRYFVDHFENLDSVALMLQVDMANGIGILDIDGDTHGASAPSWLICAAYDEFNKLGYKNLRYPTHAFSLNYALPQGSGSDHESFLNKGIPAVDFSTDVSKPIHTPQDDFANFDPRGLKRSGDLVLKLVERFDNGVPGKELSRYWLYVIGNVRVFVPYGVLWSFLVLTLVLSVTAVIVTRQRRVFPLDARFSGWKMLLFTFILVICAWFSSDVVGLLKGYRYPWYADVAPYFALAALFGVLGIWISLRLARKLRISACPYLLFKRAAIVLVIFAAVLLVADIELAIYPASALFLLSAALLVRNRLVKILLAALSPVWMIRLVFSEWGELYYRTIAQVGAQLADLPASLLYNGIMVAIFTLYLYPLVLGLAAVYRDSGSFPRTTGFFASTGSGVTLAVIAGAFIFTLYPRPVTSDLWFQRVSVEYAYPGNLDTTFEMESRFVRLRSNEYLDGIRVSRPYGDTLLDGHITEARIPVHEDEIASGSTGPAARVFVCNTMIKKQGVDKHGDTTTFDIDYTALYNVRPYTFAVTYYSLGKDLIDFSSPALFRSDGNTKTLKWYSFPDTVRVAVHFSVIGSDSVVEVMEATFDAIPPAWKFERDHTNFIERCTLTSKRVIGPPIHEE